MKKSILAAIALLSKVCVALATLMLIQSLARAEGTLTRVSSPVWGRVTLRDEAQSDTLKDGTMGTLCLKARFWWGINRSSSAEHCAQVTLLNRQFGGKKEGKHSLVLLNESTAEADRITSMEATLEIGGRKLNGEVHRFYYDCNDASTYHTYCEQIANVFFEL